MKKTIYLKLLSTFLIFTFCLIGLNYQTIKAEDKENVNLNTVLNSLEGITLSDGDTLIIDNYLIECEVSTRLTNVAKTRSNIIQDFAADLIIKISTQECVMILSHEINYTQYDTGKVHINSAKTYGTPVSSNWTCEPYNLRITNTDGSYSESTGMYELYNSGLYYYYGTTAKVRPGETPSISFTQV